MNKYIDNFEFKIFKIKNLYKYYLKLFLID